MISRRRTCPLVENLAKIRLGGLGIVGVVGQLEDSIKISHGIINELYYPSVDQPNTRDFQFLISDGETFCHEEKHDLDNPARRQHERCP